MVRVQLWARSSWSAIGDSTRDEEDWVGVDWLSDSTFRR